MTDNTDNNLENKKAVEFSRYRTLAELNSLMDKPISFLAFIWLVLIIVDVTSGLSPTLLAFSYIIWGIFILDFIIGLIIAPSKKTYFAKNWITAIAVLLPAFGMFRFFRALRAFRLFNIGRLARSHNLLRLTASSRRSIKALKAFLKTNALGTVIATTIILIFAGAAGLYHFESPNITSYTEALWWTSMIITTVGTNYWPTTPEGRIITFFIAIYALSFFSYIAANLASHFIKSNYLK